MGQTHIGPQIPGIYTCVQDIGRTIVLKGKLLLFVVVAAFYLTQIYFKVDVKFTKIREREQRRAVDVEDIKLFKF